jgi:hypothetical protein
LFPRIFLQSLAAKSIQVSSALSLRLFHPPGALAHGVPTAAGFPGGTA